MKKIKSYFSYMAYCVIALIVSVVIIALVMKAFETYESKVKYAIPMPHWIGRFDADKEAVYIDGIEKITGEETASLAYSELSCLLGLNQCYENRLSFVNIQGVMVFPFNKEYIIKYKDKNKIIISNYAGTITGEIDLNMKTLFFVNTGGNYAETPRKTQIITDTEEIKKLEKHIIRRYLRK